MDTITFDLFTARGWATIVASFFALLYYLLYRVGARKIHPYDPAVIPPKIPFVGHVLAMAIQRGKYVKTIG